MSNELTFERAKELYSLAVNAQRSKNWVYALQLFETLIKAGDPFYTPFALVGITQCFSDLARPDLLAATYKRVTQLPKEEQRLLNPSWLALCYQRSGNLTEARIIHQLILDITPNDPLAIAALAEISLMAGDLDQTDALASKLQQRAEPYLQILGRILRAFVLDLRNRHDEAATELSWVGQFIISSGNIPVNVWDYGDLQPLVAKIGPNARAMEALFDALSGRISLPAFTAIWGEPGAPPTGLTINQIS
jgi:tetratricopeptide (TPR) repeat protein